MDTEIDPTLPWRDVSAEHSIQLLGLSGSFGQGAGSAQANSSNLADSVYLHRYGTGLSPGTALENSFTLPTFPDLASNGNFRPYWLSLSNDTFASSSRDVTGSALFGSSELHATMPLPATQDLQTRVAIGANHKAGELDGRQK